MKNAAVIEPDDHVFANLKSVVDAAGEIQLYRFKNLAMFQDFLKPTPQDPNSAPALALKKSEIHLLIADLDEALKLKLEQWPALLEQLGVPGQAPRFILSAFETEKLRAELNQYILPFVFTLVAKPYDALLLNQILKISLKPPGALRVDGVFTQEKEATVEIIKDINIEVLTELGFRTINNQAIPIGKKARYYGAVFGNSKDDSVFAYCYRSSAPPEKPNEFSSSFAFFGIPRERLSLIRRNIMKSAQKTPMPFPASTVAVKARHSALMLTRDEVAFRFLKNLVDEKTADILVVHIKAMEDLIQYLPPSNQATYLKSQPSAPAAPPPPPPPPPKDTLSNVRFVFWDRSFASPESLGAVKEMVKILNTGLTVETKYILVSPDPITTYGQVSETNEFDDVFTTPFDFFYVTRKLKMHDPEMALRLTEDNSRLGVPVGRGIKTGLPVTIKAISEIHLTLFYDRPINVGESRRFVLWIPNHLQMPEIVAVCKHVAKGDGGRFLCDFLFFGVGDAELKYIRNWIKEVYVQGKLEKGPG